MPSSVIKHFRYDATKLILRVLFVSGIRYDYINVPKAIFDQMRNASSKGKFLNDKIKGKYSYIKIDPS
jgi:hypothetical protein